MLGRASRISAGSVGRFNSVTSNLADLVVINELGGVNVSNVTQTKVPSTAIAVFSVASDLPISHRQYLMLKSTLSIQFIYKGSITLCHNVHHI